VAYESNIITMVGNLTDDPELRFTGNGTPVASFRLASNRRWTDRSGEQQEETTFISVNCWRDLGENVASSLKKGDRAVVIGRLRIRSYDTSDGQTRWVTEIEADEVAPAVHGDEGRLLLLLAAAVGPPPVAGDAEVGHRGPVAQEAQLGVVGQVADHRDDVVLVRHGLILSSLTRLAVAHRSRRWRGRSQGWLCSGGRRPVGPTARFAPWPGAGGPGCRGGSS
jgi:single-strand DNA-binding protein